MALLYCDVILQQYMCKALIRCLRKFVHQSLHGDHSYDDINYVAVEKLAIKI